MAVACGDGFTTIVTEEGAAWACGNGENGQIGLGDNEHQMLLTHLTGSEVFAGEPLVMMSSGLKHTACVTKDGALWTSDNGFCSQLGHGDKKPRQRPERLGREIFGKSPVVMVACGCNYTLVLTTAGLAWNCGHGNDGQLGHGNTVDQLVLMLVAAKHFRRTQIVMVTARFAHSVAVGADGRVWTWGWNIHGQLGHNDEQNRLVPTQLTGEALGGSAAVLVAAGGYHTVAVMMDGVLWAWGADCDGQLGLGGQLTGWYRCGWGQRRCLEGECSRQLAVIITLWP